jgi:hypothetical protein
MREVFRTLDFATVNFVQAVLADAKIDSFVADRYTNTAASGGYVPLRVMVADEDVEQATQLIKEALQDADQRSTGNEDS